jgi:hypothetical protein
MAQHRKQARDFGLVGQRGKADRVVHVLSLVDARSMRQGA